MNFLKMFKIYLTFILLLATNLVMANEAQIKEKLMRTLWSDTSVINDYIDSEDRKTRAIIGDITIKLFLDNSNNIIEISPPGYLQVSDVPNRFKKPYGVYSVDAEIANEKLKISKSSFKKSNSRSIHSIGYGVNTPDIDIPGVDYSFYYLDYLNYSPRPQSKIGILSGLTTIISSLEGSNVSSTASFTIAYLIGVSFEATKELNIGAGSYVFNYISTDGENDFTFFDGFAFSTNYLITNKLGIGYKIHLPENGDSIHSVLLSWRI